MSVERVKVAQGIWKRRSADGKTERYEITYRDSNGVQRRQVIEGGRRAAETALADVKARMGKGERVAPNPRLTFEQAAEKWLASAQASLRPATASTYATHLRTHLLPVFGRKRLDHIDVDQIASFVERMRTAEYRASVEARLGRAATGEDGYAPWAIRGVLVVASRIFDHAHRRLGWAGTNPVRLLDRDERPKLRESERRIVGRDELPA